MVDNLGFREGEPKDTRAIEGLLYDAGLPVADVGRLVDSFIILERDGEITACGAAEVYDDVALLRSVAVEESVRRKGIGSKLVALLEEKAAARGVVEVCLFTVDASAFFERLGYVKGELEDWPWQARTSNQFIYVNTHWEQFEQWGLSCMYKTIVED